MAALRFSAVFLLLAVAGLMQAAAMDIREIRSKADRFYLHDEWANALAMFRLILEDDPADLQTYGRAVAVYGFIGNPEEQILLLERTQSYGLSLDGLFEEVRKSAFEKSRPSTMEDFLYLVRESQPWLRRNIDLRLARYYNSRNEASKMIAQCDMLLEASPDNPEMLHIKARGYMLLEDCEKAMPLYRSIVRLVPEDVDALLTIGVYYATEVKKRGLPSDSQEAVEALSCLKQAYRLAPTDYLEGLIASLE